MDSSTYSLGENSSGVNEYYRSVSVFCDEIIEQSKGELGLLVKEFKAFLSLYNLEKPREDEEYLLELLSFGVLWRVYSSAAVSTRIAPFITMAYFAEWRKKHRRYKSAIDFARGIFITLFLLPWSDKKRKQAEPTLENIDHACKWFEATGEFREQALRFVLWRAFWGMKEDNELKELFRSIRAFTSWFESRANEVLGSYTKNVESFLTDTKNRYLWREDRISCTRTRLEYHLNMAGAELMNRAFKREFEKTERKAVLLPGCMRLLPEGECEAERVKEGLICKGCKPECNVNRIREMGKKQNYETYIIPHASDLSLWSPKEGEPARGVVASACVTTLVEGGWELKRYNVPAQCVLLNSSGCKKHWRQEGIPTKIDIRELKSRLN
ncbi:MAG: DUF116 domain-containing protein [Ignavibacteriaceae bacterium]|nr:DUF116 domain-containing protein [Ignavibacteriaceae bacterium]